MGNETSKRNSKLQNENKNANSQACDDKQTTAESNTVQDPIPPEKQQDVIGPPIVDDDETSWSINDAVYVLSSSMQQYMPGVIFHIDDDKQEFTIRYWDIQSLELKHKVRKLLDVDSKQIKKREYEAEHDPWNMPLNEDTLADDTIATIQQRLSKHTNIMNENDSIDINEWFSQFKVFLKEKRIIRQGNPFMRLISSYLTEHASGWRDIFAKYVMTMILFQTESTNTAHLDAKLDILFNILNVGSEYIDTESLQIICIMYAKCTIKTLDQDNTKQQIAEFAEKLVQKITELDDEIDLDEFKQMIGNSREMHRIISEPVNGALSTETSKITTK